MASVQTKDYIVQLIKEEILSGVMKPGEELAQEALAALSPGTGLRFEVVGAKTDALEETARKAFGGKIEILD